MPCSTPAAARYSVDIAEDVAGTANITGSIRVYALIESEKAGIPNGR
jgi:hypothetical protein